MKNTMDIITIALCKRIRAFFPAITEIFTVDTLTMKSVIMRSKCLITSYLGMLTRLVTVDFSLRKQDPWTEPGGYISDHANQLLNRIDSIFDIRTTYNEILSLLTVQKKREFESLGLLEVCNDSPHAR